jgi:HSP20 family protein
MLHTWNTISMLDRMVDDVMGSMLGAATSARNYEPTIDIRATDDEVVFVCDLPGVRREDVEITLENHTLTINGSRKFEPRENEQVVLGRPYGAFSRSFKLPDYFDESNLSATLADGVLTISVPKHASAKPRRIPVSTGAESKQLKE